MSQDFSQFEQRKQDHIRLALDAENQASEWNRLDDVFLSHEAIPDLDFDAIDLSTKRFNEIVSVPFMVSSMTAGHLGAVNINQRLMAACQTTGWAMGVGSQRRELNDKGASEEWVRLVKAYPDVALYSNLGIAQLITADISDIHRLMDAIHAKAIIIHCNALQECIQPEGTPQFKGAWQALETLVLALDKPVIVKETGCGFGLSSLKRLNDIGVKAVDVSGLGGTHWGRLEGQRALGDETRKRTAETFKHWGITTVDAVKMAKSLSPNYEIWGSGGVRHGLDAAKLLALGASTIGFAKPLLEAALVSDEAVIALMKTIAYELKVALFCTGSSTLQALEEKLCL